MKKTIVALGAAVVALLPSLAAAHGYTVTPKSRAVWCKEGQVSGCGQAQYEPQSVEGPKGFPQAGPADGKICAGGRPEFAQLDDPDKNWPLSEVKAGQKFEFHWHLTASHRTAKWEYFVTRDGWDPAHELTREDLEQKPFFTEPGDGVSYPPQDTYHTGSLPKNKSGRHLILAVWSVADTPNAFYQCADVNFN
ncbi:lytic polysaccharide monooxygenase auxiliary activity family 9 protein [Streptomyces griseoviridis]|uniref:lytic polysaccharide monooxygenase auxiliary activity family 9 protein n=1 Tax=Streptomyces TaxID=1883 RepID=UPI002475AC75|nr:lytic polysaccharide monooxygenase [Streptomyces sp. MAA16]MDH6699522.1 putative carbohydrate-binding protein with CBM5 and CBM33 domain [Streptomyces sp. MAA16]